MAQTAVPLELEVAAIGRVFAVVNGAEEVDDVEVAVEVVAVEPSDRAVQLASEVGLFEVVERIDTSWEASSCIAR